MGLFVGWSMLDIGVRSVLIGLLVFLLLFGFLRRPRNLPPGPRGWPLLGYLPQLAMAGEEPHVIFSRLAARYGNIISINLPLVPGNLLVVLHGYDTIKEAFNQHQLSGRPRLYVTEKILPGVGIFISSGEIWTELRRFSLTVLRGFGVGKSSFEVNISTEAEFLIDEWKKHNGAPFDPRPLVANAVSNVICSVVFGQRFAYNDETFKRLIKYTDESFEVIGAGGAVEFSPILSKLTFLPSVKKYIRTSRAVVNQIRMMVQEHSRNYDPENICNLIDTFMKEIEINERLGIKPGVFNMANMARVVGDLFVAGSETTTTTLRWMMLYMMAYPEVQTRVQKELDDVTRRNRYPRMSDKTDLPYTMATICELQRIATITPLAVPHVCTEDTMLQGYNIPKGAVIVSNLWHNHFDPKVLEEPHKFRPERFLDKDGKMISYEELSPFGIGRRICLGEHLARMELFIFFTLLLHHFTFKKPQDAPPVSFKGISGATWSPLNFQICAILRE